MKTKLKMIYWKGEKFWGENFLNIPKLWHKAKRWENLKIT